MNPRSFYAPSAIALAALAALAGCGDDAAVAPEQTAQSALVASAPSTPPSSLRAPSVHTELTATNAAARVDVREPSRAEATERGVRGERADGSVRVSRLVLATDVVDRSPVGAATTFRAVDTERLFAFLEVRNDEATDAELVVVFRRVDSADRDERGGVSLTVPAAQRRWRTWSFTRHAKAPGSWEAVVRTAEGRELARAPFTVE